MKNMKFTQINIDQIDKDDKRFQISPPVSVDSLIFSIKKAGLLNPPVLTKRDKRYIIVSGWRRISACQKLSIKVIPVFVMRESSDLEAFKIPVFENLSLKDYSHIEKAAVLKKFHDFGEPPDRLIKKVMPLIKIAPRREMLDVYLKIDRLKSDIKKLAQQKNWSFKTLEIMTEMRAREVKSLYPFIQRLSLNKQKQLIENIFDIAKKRGALIHDVLNSGEFSRIKQDENLNPVQKAEKIHGLAKKKRTPSLTAWRQAFEKISKNLDLPEEMKVIPSKFFENEILTIKLDIKDKEELHKHIRKLKELSERKEISLLFDPFSHE